MVFSVNNDSATRLFCCYYLHIADHVIFAYYVFVVLVNIKTLDGRLIEQRMPASSYCTASSSLLSQLPLPVLLCTSPSLHPTPYSASPSRHLNHFNNSERRLIMIKKIMYFFPCCLTYGICHYLRSIIIFIHTDCLHSDLIKSSGGFLSLLIN